MTYPVYPTGGVPKKHNWIIPTGIPTNKEAYWVDVPRDHSPGECGWGARRAWRVG